MSDRWHVFVLRVRSFFKKLLAFLFSHVGLCGLVVGYAILGAVIFRAIELPHEMERHGHIKNDTEKLIQDLIIFSQNNLVLKEAEWKAEADRLLKDYEVTMVQAVNFEGYDGDDTTVKYQWTYFGALLYSITVFTTIGYGHICPKTSVGRGVTILYAMVGIPLMLLCLANIAETLAQIFTFIYFKICCAYCRWKKTRRRIKRAALSFRYNTQASFKRGQSVRTIRAHPGTLRRHASLRSYSSAPGRKTYSDTRSIRSFRSGREPQHDAQQRPWDTISLPGNRSRGRNGDSRSAPPPLLRREHSGKLTPGGTSTDGLVAGASSRLRRFVNSARRSFSLPRLFRRQKSEDDHLGDCRKYEAHSPKDELFWRQKGRRCRIRCSACCRATSEDGVESPDKYMQSSQASNSTLLVNSNKKCIEMKVLSGTAARILHRRASFGVTETAGAAKIAGADAITTTAAAPHRQKIETAAGPTSDEIRLPQIVINDNGREEIEHQLASDEDDDDDEDDEMDDVVCINEESGRVGITTSTVVTTAEGGGGVAESSIVMPIEDRSTLSKRSDEASLRSSRKKGNYKTEKMPVVVGILTVVLFILAGAVLFTVWEGWNFFDGAYFSFITLTTIGFGDIVPGKSVDSGSEEKLIICSFYLLFGMALIAMCFKLMQDDVVQKTRWLGQKIGILVKEDSSDEESDYEDEMGIEEEDEEESEDRTEDKRTMSSSSSKQNDEAEKPPEWRSVKK